MVAAARPGFLGGVRAQVRQAVEKEQAYQGTLSPEELGKRRAALLAAANAHHRRVRERHSGLGGLVRSVTAPVGHAYQSIARSPIGKPVGKIALLASPVPIVGLVPGAHRAFSGAANALSHGDLRNARRGLVSTGVQVAPVVQEQLKQFGPIGMAASGAIGALSTAVQGGDLEEIAWSAAEGAAPNGLDNAIRAAHQLRQGGNVATSLMEMGKNFIPKTEAAGGFNTAANLLKGTAGANPSDVLAKLGAARRALPSDQARRGFDTAIGTVSRAGREGTPGKPFAGPRVLMQPQTPRPPMAVRTSDRRAQRVLEAQPELSQGTLGQVAKTLGVSPTVARRALAAVRGRFRWNPLSNVAASFIQKHAPMSARVALRDTRGLSEGNAVYVVESGDGPIKIGNKLLGTGYGDAHWHELIKANPSKAVRSDGNFKILAVGERLQLPATWTGALNAKIGPSAGPPPAFPAAVPQAQAQGSRIVIVQSGEGPSQIAKAITGDGGQARTLELRNLNLPKDADGRARKSDGQSGFTPGLNPGDRLFVPLSWPSSPRAVAIAAPVATPAPAPVALPVPVVFTPPASGPAPAPASTSSTGPDSDVASILQAKAILAAWGKTDGVGEAGLTDYGERADDLTPAFGARDGLMLASFSSWSNRTRGTNLASGTQLLPEHVDALRAWAEQRAALPLPPGVVVGPVVAPSPIAPPSAVPAPPTKPAAAGSAAPAPSSSGGGGGALIAVGIPLLLAFVSK